MKMIHRRLTCVAALLMVCGLVGCDRGTAATEPLREANLTLRSLAPEGRGGPAVAARGAAYTKVISALKPVADEGTAGEKSAAYLLLAQAQAGLAERSASEAAEIERGLQRDLQGVRDSLSHWMTSSAIAAAAASYDPTRELAEIDAQIKEKTDLRVVEQQKKAAVDAKVEAVRGEAAALSERGRAKRQEAGTIKAGTAAQSAVEAETSTIRAREIAREADALEVQAATLEANALQQAPESVEIQLQIDRLTNQKELLEKAREDVLRRAETAKAQAAEARAAAAAAAATIKQRVEAVDKRRAEALEGPTAAAIKGYTDAAQFASKASGAKGVSQLSAGSLKQSVGDAQWTKARGLTAYAETMEALASVSPALPEAASYRQKAEAAKAEAKEALEAATEAYEAADGAFGAGGNGLNAERVSAVNAALGAIVERTSGGAKNIRKTDTPAEEPGTATPSETSAGGVAADSPQATLQALVDLQKSKQYDRAVEFFATKDETERAALGAVLGLAQKGEALDAAMKAKFGKGLEEAGAAMGGAMPGGMGGGAMDAMKDLDASSVAFTVEGDKATGTLPGGQKMTMVRQDGKWRIDMGSMGVPAEEIGMVAAMVGPMGKAMDEVTAEINGGKHATMEAAMMSFGQKVAGAMGLPGGGGKR